MTKYVYTNRIVYKRNGVIHRCDGPAVEWTNGTAMWYINGVLHRCDGPAIIRAHGPQEWYINGVCLTSEINQWISDNNFNRYYFDWTQEQKLQFKIVWG